jgi:hypothetical protein
LIDNRKNIEDEIELPICRGSPAGTDVETVQKTDYPWRGRVAITVNPATNKRFAVHVRVPDRLPANFTLHCYRWLDSNRRRDSVSGDGEAALAVDYSGGAGARSGAPKTKRPARPGASMVWIRNAE